MKILHYSLGLPPYRSGGLTKYSIDLMLEQVKLGNEVMLLFPGRIGIINNNIKILFYKNYKNVKVYELINPLPVPLLNGIAEPNLFIKECDKSIFIKYIKKINPDIVHIHTFMGLYKEFLEACNELGIKVVFTSHDYFGICSKVNFINENGELCDSVKIENCARCNSKGDKLNKIRILQSPLYRYIKNKGIIDILKKYIKKEGNLSKYSQEIVNKTYDYNAYAELNKYYKSMYKSIDKIFFNSELTRSIYSKYLDNDGYTIPITHSDIKDNRELKLYNNEKILNLTYLGPYKEYKGFFMLLNVMEQLNNEGHTNIKLNIYGDTSKDIKLSKHINDNGKYSYSELKNIFKKTDLLIVPSICNETFGFITLEALSYGVPVLATNKVGSKDLLNNNNFIKGEVIGVSEGLLKDKILEYSNDIKKLKKFNDSILKDEFKYEISMHCIDVCNKYKKILKLNE